ncbi:MAG TPA: hypothetical protein VES97_11365 [Solirubrobacteraceae bacterium]|nr:hypothetical protein [Solirubrobacteraceae bacterium]
MHWGLAEVLAVIAGAAFMVVALVLAEAGARARMQALLAGVLLVGYGIYMGSQSSGVVVVPVAAIAAGLAAPLFLYLHARDGRKLSTVLPVPPGTVGARRCLGCGRTYPADTPGPCPACRGTLALRQSPTSKEG